MMVKEMKITKQVKSDNMLGHKEGKDIILTIPVDMILFITDFRIVELVRNKYSVLMHDDMKHIDEFAIQPMVLDRTYFNILEWLDRGNHKDINYDEILEDMYIRDYEFLYKDIEPTIFGANLNAMIAKNDIKEFNIIVHHDENVRKKQIECIVNLLGKYSYRVNIIIPDKGETFIESITHSAPRTNTLMYPSCDILKGMEDNNFDLNNMTITINEMSYNFEDTGEKITYRGDIFNKLETTQLAIGYITVKNFKDIKYFTFG